jgi:hypothetical protein
VYIALILEILGYFWEYLEDVRGAGVTSDGLEVGEFTICEILGENE